MKTKSAVDRGRSVKNGRGETAHQNAQCQTNCCHPQGCPDGAAAKKRPVGIPVFPLGEELVGGVYERQRHGECGVCCCGLPGSPTPSNSSLTHDSYGWHIVTGQREQTLKEQRQCMLQAPDVSAVNTHQMPRTRKMEPSLTMVAMPTAGSMESFIRSTMVGGCSTSPSILKGYIMSPGNGIDCL